MCSLDVSDILIILTIFQIFSLLFIFVVLFVISDAILQKDYDLMTAQLTFFFFSNKAFLN